MRLHLLRHGQTHANVSGALDTALPGLELTDLGHRQAIAAAHALADARIGKVGVSSLTRTHQTVEPLATRLGLVPSRHDGLREITAGAFEMRRDHDAVHGFLETIGDWLDGDLGRRMPGGETGVEFLERYDDAIATFCADAPDVALVVSHGAAIRTWVSHRASGDHAPAHEGLHNTGCITLDGDPSTGWQILEWEREPIGGDWLDDLTAPDPTGEDLDPDETADVDPGQSSGS